MQVVSARNGSIEPMWMVKLVVSKSLVMEEDSILLWPFGMLG
jgi:hypothetical protein